MNQQFLFFCQSLMVEIENYEPNIEQVAGRVKALQADCNPEQSAELDNIYAGLYLNYLPLTKHLGFSTKLTHSHTITPIDAPGKQAF